MGSSALLRRRVMTCGFALAALSCGGVTRVSEDDVGSGGTGASSHASGGKAPAQAGGRAPAGAGGRAPAGAGGGAAGCGAGTSVPCLHIPPPEPAMPAACATIALDFALDPLDGGKGCGGKLPQPPGEQPINPRLVNLSYTDGNTRQVLVYVETAGACGTELGWYYDNPAHPTEVFGCPRTCEAASSPSGYVRIDLQLGCPVKIPDF